jgi:hypothetical protein
MQMLFKACLEESCHEGRVSQAFGEADLTIEWVTPVASEGAARSWWDGFFEKLKADDFLLEKQLGLDALDWQLGPP